MTNMVCSKCGRPVQFSRCVICGGTPVASSGSPVGERYSKGEKDMAEKSPSPQPENSNPDSPQDPPRQPQNPQPPLSQSQPQAPRVSPPDTSKMDPRLAQIEQEIYEHKIKLEENAQISRELKEKLASELASLNSIKVQEEQKIKAQLQTQLRDLECQAQDEKKAFQKLQDRIIVNYRNELTGLVAKVNDDLNAIKSDVAVEINSNLSAKDLPGNLDIRRYINLGSMDLPAGDAVLNNMPQHLPTLVPLMDSGNIVFECSKTDPQFASMLLQTVSQAYTSLPGGQLVVTVLEESYSDILSPFHALGDIELFKSANLADENELNKEIDKQKELIDIVQRSMQGRYNSMGDLIRDTGVHEHQYKLLVILDAPKLWSEKVARHVSNLMDNACRYGMSIVLQYDPAEGLPRDVNMDRVLKNSTRICRTNNSWSITLSGKTDSITFKPHEGISENEIDCLCKELRNSAEQGVLPDVPFDTMFPKDASWMEKGSNSELTASGMSMMLGKAGNRIVDLELGNKDSNINYLLVGGQTGSGKTVLLKTLIYSLAARYAPDEMRLFLLDFKQGVEFKQFVETPFGQTPLPHAEVVSTESDPEFGLATLDYFYEERIRRSELFKEAQVQNILEYRKKTGEKLPRWLLIIDEFQGLFEGNNYREASDKFDDFVRQNRSYGLHLILASQTLSGIRFAADKESSIFANIPARIVLAQSPQESVKFLQPGNIAASKLRYRGQAILNTHSGDADSNQQFIVAYGSNEYYFKLQNLLYQAALDANLVDFDKQCFFAGDATVTSTELLAKFRPERLLEHRVTAWYGKESSIKGRPAATILAPASGAHILILGSTQLGNAIATAQLATLSAIKSSTEMVNLIIFHSLSEDTQRKCLFDEWITTLQTISPRTDVYTWGDEDDFLERINEAKDSPERYLVIILSPEDSDLRQSFKSRGSWSQLLRELPRKHINVIAQYSSEQDVPDNSEIKSCFKTVLFVGANELLISKVTGRVRQDIPRLKPSRTIVFSQDSSQDGFQSVVSIEPFSAEELNEWRVL